MNNKKKKKKKFKVAVEWSMMGFVYQEADDLDEAIQIVNTDPDIPLPENGEYMDGSFSTNHQASVELNT